MEAADLRDESWDVFISFAWPDRSHAEELTQILEEHGFVVFLSNQALDAGTNWM
jgi:hypothetical protein